jgi:putative cell wall-binding protein
LIAVVSVVVILAGSSAGADFSNLTSSGRGWAPCATIVLRPDSSGEPSGLDLVDATNWASALVNDAVGRVVVAVGGPPEQTRGPFDVPVRYRDTFHSDAVVFEGSSGHIEWANINISSFARDQAELRAAVVHEVGHALALGHVPDSREVMSYGWVDRGQGIGPGSSQALRHLYNAPCDSHPATFDSPINWPWNDRSGYESRNFAAMTTIAEETNTLVELAIAVGFQSLSQDRGQPFEQVVVCRDDVFADCLGGAALAGDTGTVVFVPGGSRASLPGAVRDALEQWSAFGDFDVYVLGGGQAVSAQIEAELAERWTTTRLFGSDRFATAAAVAEELTARVGPASRVLIARADDGIDAVTASAWAAARDVPVLLAAREGAPSTTLDAIRSLRPRDAVLVGGEAALSSAVEDQARAAGLNVTRVAGRSRTETSVAVAHALWGRTTFTSGPNPFLVTNGWHAESAGVVLASAPLSARLSAPVLLTGYDEVPFTPAAWPYPGDPGWFALTAPSATDARPAFIGVGGFPWVDALRVANTTGWAYTGYDS